MKWERIKNSYLYLRNRTLTTFCTLIYFFIVFSICPLLYLLKNREEPSLVVLSLTKDQIFKNSTPLEVVKFFREERFRDDYDSRTIIIECRSYRIFLKKCHKNYVLDVPFYLLTHFLPFRSVLQNILKNSRHLLDGAEPLKISKIKKQLIDKSIWESYISQRRDQLFLATTLSTMINPTLPFTLQRHQLITRIMFWYSTNIKPIEMFGSNGATPEHFHNLGVYFDRHLVWDTSHSDFISKFKTKDIRIRGSMLFQPRLIDWELRKLTRILFFDITPLEETKGFYSESMSLCTLNSLVKVIEVVKEKEVINVEILVKPKRKYTSIFSKKYISRLKNLEKQDVITLLNPNSNLYEEISKAKIVICTPFTSPAIIARELNVPACFFTRSSDDWNIPKIENNFEVIRTEQSLMDFIINNLKA